MEIQKKEVKGKARRLKSVGEKREEEMEIWRDIEKGGREISERIRDRGIKEI